MSALWDGMAMAIGAAAVGLPLLIGLLFALAAWGAQPDDHEVPWDEAPEAATPAALAAAVTATAAAAAATATAAAPAASAPATAARAPRPASPARARRLEHEAA